MGWSCCSRMMRLPGIGSAPAPSMAFAMVSNCRPSRADGRLSRRYVQETRLLRRKMIRVACAKNAKSWIARSAVYPNGLCTL